MNPLGRTESDWPVTRTQLASDLSQLGLGAGMVVMAHTSLKSLGRVVGGEQTVLDALRGAVGPDRDARDAHAVVAAVRPGVPSRGARCITAVHDLGCPAGERSPLRALYDLDGFVLLLGTTPAKITALHLAEHRAQWPGKHLVGNGAALIRDGSRTWVTWDELWVEDDDFDDVVNAFVAAGGASHTNAVGNARAQLLPIRPLVDFAAGWLNRHRTH